MEFAVVGIVAGNAKATGKDQLVSSVDFANDWGAVAARVVWAIDFPDGLAGLLVQGDKVTRTVVVAIDYHRVFPNDG